jgi:hypothetical protein
MRGGMLYNVFGVCDAAGLQKTKVRFIINSFNSFLVNYKKAVWRSPSEAKGRLRTPRRAERSAPRRVERRSTGCDGL